MAIYKRKNSKYYWFKFYFDGELIQQSSKCTSKVKAREVETAFRHQLVLGRIGIKPKVKAPGFDEAVKDFLEWSKVNHTDKPNSHKRVKYSCQAIKKFFGKTKVDRIKPKDVESFILWRSRQTSKKTKDLITRDTINLELIALKSILKRLVSMDILDKNPAKTIKQLPENDRKFYVLSRDEEKRYLLACPQPLQDVAILILETGMRPSEIYNLKRENVSIKKGFLNIEKSKTKSSNRKIWLSDKASNVLRARLERFKGENIFPKGDKDGNQPTYHLNDQHRTARKRIGLSFRLYDCRHTFATRAVESGTDLLTLAHLLGHSSLNEVMRYAHVNEKGKAEAIQNMQRKFAKAV
ncbi:MAG: tyrosine-type recombinase/integrase [Aridibacter sp.]